MTTKTKREEEKEKEEEEEEETTTRRSSSGSSSGSSSSSEKEVRDFIKFSLFVVVLLFSFRNGSKFSFAQKTTRFFSDARGGGFPFSVLSLFETRAHALSLSLSVCVYFFVAGSTAGSVERQRERFGRGRR